MNSSRRKFLYSQSLLHVHSAFSELENLFRVCRLVLRFFVIQLSVKQISILKKNEDPIATHFAAERSSVLLLPLILRMSAHLDKKCTFELS